MLRQRTALWALIAIVGAGTQIATQLTVSSASARADPPAGVILNVATSNSGVPSCEPMSQYYENDMPSAGKATVRNGQAVALCGKVSGASVAGRTLLLQESPTRGGRSTGPWLAFTDAKVAANGDYTATYLFSRTSRTAVYAMRVQVWGSSAISRVVYVTVHPSASTLCIDGSGSPTCLEPGAEGRSGTVAKFTGIAPNKARQFTYPSANDAFGNIVDQYHQCLQLDHALENDVVWAPCVNDLAESWENVYNPTTKRTEFVSDWASQHGIVSWCISLDRDGGSIARADPCTPGGQTSYWYQQFGTT